MKLWRRRRPIIEPRITDEQPVAWRVRKEDAACCVARRDDLGRLPIGFCSPDCIRRPG